MARYAIVVVGVCVLALDQCVSQDTICSGDVGWLNDGFCDYANNNLACGYDGGDCCECTCVDNVQYYCESNGFNCLDPACPDEDPSPYPDCTENLNWLNDGWCDPETNNMACGYDGGDCCECTCMDSSLYRCGSNGYDCADPACFDLASAIEYPECTGNRLSIGDGSCAAENNNQACGYDGGDCCLCTCSGRACVYNDFDCLDPNSAGTEIYDCTPPPRTGLPCSAEGQRMWVVEDSAQARALAEAVNCSGGSFEVLWSGEVVVDKTIYVFDGTVLNVTGFGLTATMDGNFATRLLTVANASVHITGVNMSYGAGTVGGAVAAARSTLTFNGTTFFGNDAAGHGGAVFASDSSVVSLVGLSSFTDNTAAIDGGAVIISNSLCTGENMSFFNNTAGGNGGAVMITEHSRYAWRGEATYHGNRAGRAGGAISAQHGSSVVWRTTSTFQSNRAEGNAGALALQSGSSGSWYGETTFDNNSARHHAGALRARDASQVSWNATTIFSNNRAGSTGGAMQVYNTSSVSWSGNTSYVGNSGVYGGAMLIKSRSTVFSDGNTTFSANTAQTHGGAVLVSDYSIVLWMGDTAFSRNSAGDGGAVYAESNANLSFGGITSFRGNIAVSADIPETSRSGGALVLRYSVLTASGETVFANNQALRRGGAVFAANATILWTGRSSFRNNSCNESGGALGFLYSIVGFGGNSTFFYNSATDGGAVHSDESVVTWVGDAEFSNNLAFFGGALTATFSSSITWSGITTLAHNIAFGNNSGTGGALGVFNGSRVSWSGQVLFVNNSAHSFGGAAYISTGSNITWSGSTLFFGCTSSYGGALYVLNGSAAEWSGRTEFSSNEAVVSGGAVGSSFPNERNNPHGSTLVIDGPTRFANNTAGSTGGGLALSGTLSVAFQSRDILFIGNSADVVGGAVFASGYSVGLVFSAVIFVANFAGAGGGAYVIGSGQEEISAFNIVPASATKFDGCQFVDNRATETGGAIESVAGQDLISNTIFIGNTAAIGGAVRLGGKTFMDNCSFVDNRSDEEEGPAVDNVGFVGRITDSSFIGNVFNCEPGTYLDSNESGNAFEVECNGCGVSCQGCNFEESVVVPICIQAMQHATSSGGASTVETISINPGFWRATSTGTEVLACHRDEACLGGITGSPGFCLTGYGGPYCSICGDGYAAGFGFACDTCSDKAGGIALTVVLAVVALIGAAATASYTMSGQLEGGGHGTIGRVTRFIPLQSIKIVIVALQIVTQFTAIANVTYPSVYQRFLDTVNVLNFDLGWVARLSAGCLFDVGIHGHLLIATIGPIIAITFLGVTYVVATNANRGSAEALSLVRHRHVSMVLLLTFLVYSSVSSILFQMFACEDLEDGQSYLRADYRVQCDSSKHRAFQIYAGFMIVLYTVGIPTLYTSLLFRSRRVLTDEVGREENPSTKSFSDLWEPYKPSIFYYEVVECGRRVLLTGTVVFIYPNTSAQIAVTLMLAFVFAIISEALAPFASRWDTWINRMGHVVVYVSMYVALLLKVDVSDERSSSQKVFEAVLVVAHLSMILGVIIEAGVMMCSLKETIREGISPRFRGT